MDQRFLLAAVLTFALHWGVNILPNKIETARQPQHNGLGSEHTLYHQGTETPAFSRNAIRL